MKAREILDPNYSIKIFNYVEGTCNYKVMKFPK